MYEKTVQASVRRTLLGLAVGADFWPTLQIGLGKSIQLDLGSPVTCRRSSSFTKHQASPNFANLRKTSPNQWQFEQFSMGFQLNLQAFCLLASDFDLAISHSTNFCLAQIPKCLPPCPLTYPAFQIIVASIPCSLPCRTWCGPRLTCNSDVA